MERKIYHRMCSALVCCLLIGLTGCINQNVGKDMGKKATDGKVTLKMHVRSLIGTEEFLFGCGGEPFCLDWDVEDLLTSVIITSDSQYIIAGCHEYLYKFTRNGELVWKKPIGGTINTWL
jgi:hypothetical protein